MRKSVQGGAAVELAILLIPLMILAFGIIEYGRAIYTYNALTKSVRDAARFLTSQTPGDSSKHSIAKCMAVFGSPTCGEASAALAPGLTTLKVDTCDRILTCDGVTTTLSTGSGTINLVVVRIHDYQYDSALEIVMPDITFDSISESMRGQL